MHQLRRIAPAQYPWIPQSLGRVAYGSARHVQQLQGRDDHFENVGKFLLDLSPDTTFL